MVSRGRHWTDLNTEVKAETIGGHVRAPLLDIWAQHLPQGPVKHVCGRVVDHAGQPVGLTDRRTDRQSVGQTDATAPPPPLCDLPVYLVQVQVHLVSGTQALLRSHLMEDVAPRLHHSLHRVQHVLETHTRQLTSRLCPLSAPPPLFLQGCQLTCMPSRVRYPRSCAWPPCSE